MTTPTVYQITSTTLGGYDETATEKQIRDCLEQMRPTYDPDLLTTGWRIDDDKTIYDTLLYDGEEVAREIGH